MRFLSDARREPGLSETKVHGQPIAFVESTENKNSPDFLCSKVGRGQESR